MNNNGIYFIKCHGYTIIVVKIFWALTMGQALFKDYLTDLWFTDDETEAGRSNIPKVKQPLRK